MSTLSRGNFLNGEFVSAQGAAFTSRNPADRFSPVFEINENIVHVDDAVQAARGSLRAWSALPLEKRIAFLQKVALQFKQREQEISVAISREMGKILSESLAEAQNLSARVSLMVNHGLKRVATEYPIGVAGETRYHAQGVLAVIGPYNFPAHLLNAHIIPALLTGNSVVVKPSEHCVLTGELYARCFADAGLPPGVFNLIQGGIETSKKLVAHSGIDGVLFTGSYKTGRAIKEAVLDQPHKQLALELGGKNFAVVLNDADLYQALSEIINGAFLTTGQRCTATSRVLLQKGIANRFIESLCRVTQQLNPGDPMSANTMFGPLANQSAFQSYTRLVEHSLTYPVEAVVPHRTFDDGGYVAPSINLLTGRYLDLPGYFDEEFFGPHLAVEIIEDVEDAIERINHSPYGLSNALFTADKHRFEEFYAGTRVGVLNWNRSTNGANGQLPFGGVGKSGNQRAAGIDAVRYTTYPVAINYQIFGETMLGNMLEPLLRSEENQLQANFGALVNRHRIEALLERYRLKIADVCGETVLLYKQQFEQLVFDATRFATIFKADDKYFLISLDAKTHEAQYDELCSFLAQLAQDNFVQLFHNAEFTVHAPVDGQLPSSEALLNRLYSRKFVPREKKSAVIDLHRSIGGYLCSVDEDPLVFFDAASQIASVGVGFQPAVYRRSLDEGEFNHCLAANVEMDHEGGLNSPLHDANQTEIDRFSALLLEQAWPGLIDVTFCSSGAESNEIAFQLCRENGTSGRRVIAFNGSFHGRTLLSLQSTHSPEKRKGFEFKGYESVFLPFPTNTDASIEPTVSDEWIASWTRGDTFAAAVRDDLLAQEIAVLSQLKKEIQKGDICCVIIEPMQSEGGDNYASARFFNGLRALTRGLNIPLIFDEVQTGFCLGGPFYWHSLFNLRDASGAPDGPDCITLAKKAQLGAVVSAWPNHYKIPPHIMQIARGRRQAEELLACRSDDLQRDVMGRLLSLGHNFPALVACPRSQGYAFAFDMPTKELAMGVIEQRFYRGFMGYIAGEKTIRFRLNLATREKDLKVLFDALTASLVHIQEFLTRHPLGSPEKYVAPKWVNNSGATAQSIKIGELPQNLEIEEISVTEFEKFAPEIRRLEHAAYETGRRDNIEEMHGWLQNDLSVALAAYHVTKQGRHLCGFAFGGPLEKFLVDGPKQDVMRGQNNTFYSANIVIEEEFRGQQLGLLLKQAQISRVLEMKKADGTFCFDYMTGRNRIGYTSAMTRITRAFGAYPVAIHDNQYGEVDAQALYYRICLRAPAVKSFEPVKTSLVDWSSGVQAPFGGAPASIVEDICSGHYSSAIATKLTLSNFVTPDFVRYAELVHHIAPLGLKHAYFSSGRDEMVDKAIKVLRVARPAGEVVIGLSHQFLGTSTAAARSLTDSTGRRPEFKWFDWPIICHPTVSGLESARLKINSAIKQQTPQRVLGIIVELIGEHSGLSVSSEFLELLEQIRSETGIPLVFVESASAFGRSGKTFFLSDSLPVKPNIVLWYAGSQLGHVFVDDNFYVEKPLTLISTWDGDEISMRRNYQHIVLGKRQLAFSQAKIFAEALGSLKAYVEVSGEGLWQALVFKDARTRDQVYRRCLAEGLLLKKGLPTHLIMCPPIDIAESDIVNGVAVVENVLRESNFV